MLCVMLSSKDLQFLILVVVMNSGTGYSSTLEKRSELSVVGLLKIAMLLMQSMQSYSP